MASTNGTNGGPKKTSPKDRALDAEANVLSSCIDPVVGPVAFAEIKGKLRPFHFFSKANGWIFEAIEELTSEGRAVDFTTVWNRIRERDRDLGIGISYFRELEDATPSHAHVGDYAQIVIDASNRAELLKVSEVVANLVNAGGRPQEIVRDLRTALEKIEPTSKSVSNEPAPVTPSQVVELWRADGPLLRVPTGIGVLDRMSHGGLPVPWRVAIVGAPSAGKTAFEVIVADYLARAADAAGLCVGILAVDEDPEDLTVRLAQMAGYSLADVERRDPAILDAIAQALSGMRVRFFDATHTIEDAACNVAGWAGACGRRGALFLDSLQAVRSNVARSLNTPREIVEANVAAMRAVATRHRLLVVATSEANRRSYQDADAAENSNDLSAGAESRAIEFGAQTMLMLRTPKDEPDTIHVRVPKNRRAQRGEFWLRLDRERHSLSECGNPAEDPKAAEQRIEEKRAGTRTAVQKDAEIVAQVVRNQPGIGSVALRAALKAAGHGWGVDRVNAAIQVLVNGHKGMSLANRGPHSRSVQWHIEATPEGA